MQETPLVLTVLVKCAAHWVATGLPLVIASPLLGLFMNMNETAIGVTALTLLVGSPAITFIGAVGAAVAVAFDALGPGFGRAVAAGGQQAAVDQETAMGAGADAGVVAVAPIGQVVAALGAGSGVVGDLVGQQAEAGGGLPGGVVEGGSGVVVGQIKDGKVVLVK